MNTIIKLRSSWWPWVLMWSQCLSGWRMIPATFSLSSSQLLITDFNESTKWRKGDCWLYLLKFSKELLSLKVRVTPSVFGRHFVSWPVVYAQNNTVGRSVLFFLLADSCFERSTQTYRLRQRHAHQQVLYVCTHTLIHLYFIYLSLGNFPSSCLL